MDSSSMASCDDTRPPQRAKPTEAALKDSVAVVGKHCLSIRPKQRFNRLDDQGLTIAKTIVAQLFRVSDQSLGVESRIAALAVVIAVHPDRDVLGICHLVAGVLLACDFCNIERDLCPSHANGVDRDHP